MLRSENFLELSDATESSGDGDGEMTAERLDAKVAARKARREEKRKAAQDRAARRVDHAETLSNATARVLA